MERRSGKRATPRKRYTVDAFEGVEELRDAPSENDNTNLAPENDDSGDDFAAGGHSSTEDDVMSGPEENMPDAESSGGSDAGERLLDDSMSIVEDPDDPVTPRRAIQQSRRGKTETNDVHVKTYTRGVADKVDLGSRGARQRLYFGPSGDCEPIHAAQARWAKDPCLPSREGVDNGLGGMHRSLHVNDASVAAEASYAQKWWINEGGRSAFLEKQSLEPVDESQIAPYMPEREHQKMSFVMGPFSDQRLFHVDVSRHLPLRNAWQSETESTDNMPESYKAGFMINIGDKVQCLEWAPNQNGQYQYLAASVMPRREPSHPPFEAPQAPAFTPQPQHSSNVQIWKFKRTGKGSIDVQSPPQLSIVYCTDWADARDLKWCPVGFEDFEEHSLGLLAGIWSDGAIRVLYVTIPSASNETRYLKFNRVAFESKPPNTICTGLTWLGSSRIVASCANGCIAVWDIPNSLKSASTNARPDQYNSISNSYILSIVSCYPSRPNLILTSTMDGYIAMTDLSSPGQSLGSPANTVYSNRNRILQPRLTWHDFAQTAMYMDDHSILVGSTIRRIFKTVQLGKYRSNAVCCAVSPCHPFALVGTMNGEVIASNPVTRMLDGKRSNIWQQTWFAHEWRRPTEDELRTSDASTGAPSSIVEASNDSTNSVHNGLKVEPTGLSRISEGFKAERITFNADERLKDESSSATIYEEATAITALAWNPNLEVGGWAAAGMGDGLLRVEDIAG